MFFNLRLFFSSALVLLAIVTIVAAHAEPIPEKRQISSDVGNTSIVFSTPTNVATSRYITPTPTPSPTPTRTSAPPPPPPNSGALPRHSFTLFDIGLALGGVALGAIITFA